MWEGNLILIHYSKRNRKWNIKCIFWSTFLSKTVNITSSKVCKSLFIDFCQYTIYQSRQGDVSRLHCWQRLGVAVKHRAFVLSVGTLKRNKSTWSSLLRSCFKTVHSVKDWSISFNTKKHSLFTRAFLLLIRCALSQWQSRWGKYWLITGWTTKMTLHASSGAVAQLARWTLN